ncbi:MAG: serpin family protein [Nitrospirota bacterium]
MRRFLSWLTGTRESRAEQGPPQPELDSPARGNTRFTLDLYAQLKDCVGPYENVACSPFGVSLALATIHAGARGQTEDHLARVLRSTTDDDPWQTTLAGLRERLIAGAKNDDCVLGLANSLWAPTGLPLRNEFSETVGRSYGADVKQADFSHEEPARTLINQWLRETTRQLFDAVVARGEITPDTRLVSINALCFKGYWTTPFGAQQTLDEPFWVNPHTKTIVPMMWQRGTFPYGQFPFHFADRVQVIELPYAGVEFSMVLLLPEGLEGIIELEHTLGRQKGKLDPWLSALCPREIDVALPKFTVGSRFHLGDTLIGMGVTDAFSREDADFSGMRGERDLWLSHAFHQALVAIDEFGATDDAAASGGDSPTRETGRTTPRPVPMFRADHPFLFLIRQRASGQILFMGRVMVPTIAQKFTPVL